MVEYFLGKTLTINSIFHFLIPFGIGYLLKKKWFYGIGILILFEILENSFSLTISLGNWTMISPEPLVNIIADLIIGTGGLYLGCRLRNYIMENKE
ncbi:MAG TPA: hypothetical protein VJ912_03845 [Candidatus Nanoarchaeia archaeon]|nr:hypothetical protein [Candidatus Nanoarchaeia archaeon]